ncbi:MAG: NlpC/P60 family protein [Bacteroidota bacterium]
MNDEEIRPDILEEFKKLDKRKNRRSAIFLVSFITLSMFTGILIYNEYIKETELIDSQLEQYTEVTETLVKNIPDSVYSKFESIEVSETTSDQVKLAVELMNKTPEIPFKWAGKSEEGFDSSGFIAYILSKTKNISDYKSYWSGKLKEVYGIKTDSRISEGDIVFYESGVCMFYMGEDKCIGMVPGGITILEIKNIWNYVGYGQVD